MSEPATIASTSYTPGTWFGIIGESATVLLPPSEKSRAGALWALVDDGAGFDEVLDALVATGLSSLPGFVLISGDVTPDGGSVRTVVRGPSVVSFESVEGSVEVDGSSSKTWVERTLEGVTRMSVSLGDEGVTGEPMTALGGLLRVSGLEVPPPAPESSQDDSPESRAGFVGAPVAVEEAADDSVEEPAQADPLTDPLPEESYADSAEEQGLDEDEPVAAPPSLSVVPPIPVSGDLPGLGNDSDADPDEPVSVNRGEESGDAPAPRHDDLTEPTEAFEMPAAQEVDDQNVDDQDYPEHASRGYEDDYASDEHAAAVASSFGPSAVSPEPVVEPEVGPDAETEVLAAVEDEPYDEKSYDEQRSFDEPESAQARDFGPPSMPPPPPLTTPPPPPVDVPPAPFEDAPADGLIDSAPIEPPPVDAPAADIPPAPPAPPAFPAPPAPPAPPVAPIPESRDEPVWEEPTPDEDDHDGLTRVGVGEDLNAGLAGIPGQPEAPKVTAYPVARLEFSSGDRVDVDRVVLVGRAPEASRFTPTEQPMLVTVPSPHQEISSTHCEIRPGAGVDHGAAVVTDLGSTNGTVLVQPGLGPEDLRPGVPVQLMPGAVIDLGDSLTIRVTNP
ncbi:FHA domain-containing protein [Nocardioides sp. KC13]|uniref:FHA domain-containing protein n=1 Tax=Nocardioides turkmenicus TaxID=2711220 RepID=A0A6M1R1C7_9ACTN|nr:FHA domain-containing protein [Nocardioides sp. KC13]NGN96083.1 FHA domain-containing protein [Nocardioides sp. KC13]